MLYVVDTETTGHHREQEVPEVIELAVYSPHPAGAGSTWRFKPTKEITFGAMAVHHIIPSELENCAPSAKAGEYLPADMQYMVGHNVDYDWKALGSPNCKRICTLAIARNLWPDTEHNLGALTYMLAGWKNYGTARLRLKDAHSALADTLFCYEILCAAANKASKSMGDWEALWKWSEFCRIPTTWSFGKFRGQPFKSADRGYMQWCLRQADMDNYVKQACRIHLGMEAAPTT